MKCNPRKSWILDSRYWIPDVSGSQIAADSNHQQDSGFHEQNHKFQIPGFRFPQANSFSNSGILITLLGGNDSHKQTNKNNSFLGSQIDFTLSNNFGTYQAIKKLTQKMLTYYCLKMQTDKRGIRKCQREHEWLKLNQILHSGKF